MQWEAYKRTARDLWCCGVAWCRQRPLPANCFVIFGRGRSGSTLLVDLLNCHPQIFCAGEILRQPVLMPIWRVRRHALPHAHQVYGFKLLTYQLREVQPLPSDTYFLQALQQQGYRIIYLKRNNFLRQAISLIRAETWRFHQRGSDSGYAQPVTINIDQLIRYIQGFEAKCDYETRALSTLPHLSLTYETDLALEAQQRQTENRLFEYLELPPVAVKTRLKKLVAPSLADAIANYSAVQQALLPTKYSRFLEP
ncbi:MAG: Nodulation protein H [Cyanobacteria bacterium J06635_1]